MNFVVVGAGAWGTAFALHLARAGHAVVLAPRRAEHAATLSATRQNPDYLPNIFLPDAVRIESQLENALAGAEVVLLACPAQALRDTCGRLKRYVDTTSPRLVVSLAKGLELATHLRPSQVIAATIPQAVAGSLTGPTNAGEVARGLPAAMVLAVSDPALPVQSVQSALSGPTLRVYTSDDVAGVEYGGSLKNI